MTLGRELTEKIPTQRVETGQPKCAVQVPVRIGPRPKLRDQRVEVILQVLPEGLHGHLPPWL
jgi:hypothetical protein